MSTITKAQYTALVAEARALGITEQPYTLANILLNLGGGGGSVASLTDILNAIQTYGANNVTDKNTSNNTAKDIPAFSTDGLNIAYFGGIYYNPNAYPVFLKFYEGAAADVVVGTTPIVYQLMIPALGQVVLDSSTVYFYATEKISYATTKFYGSSDTTAITTDLEVFHKVELQIS